MQWISVDDSLPEEGAECFFVLDGYRFIGKFEGKSFCGAGIYNSAGCRVTTLCASHWRPLPALPAE